MWSAVEEFFHEAFGATDYELTMKGIKPSAEERDDEFSSLLGTDKGGIIKRRFPATIHPFRLENYGIAISFFNTGIALFLLTTPATYYLINELGASSSQVNAFVTLTALPWSMKLLFGFVTDGISIFGYRRKSWMLLGWILYCFFLSIISFVERPGITIITTIMFLSTCAYIQADVCNDAQSIERSKFEPVELRGSYQTTMTTIRGFGMIIGSLQAALLYNTTSFGWGLTLQQLFWLGALIPMTTIIPFSYLVVELKNREHYLPDLFDSLQKVWEILQLKAVWYPLIFYLPYYCLQLSNSALSNYMVLGN